MRQSGLRAWLAPTLLIVAIAAGGFLRFVQLDKLELSADEGASWAAAAAPSLGQVIRMQTRLNPGELGLHDAALHLWMRLFGDSLTAMRALSATAGTVAILLVFIVVREILALAPRAPDGGSTVDAGFPSDANLLAAVAAVIFAVNLVTIKYSREVRMYPLGLALGLAQVCLFARSLRLGTMLAYAGLTILTALAIAATYTAGLVLIPEVLYLAALLARKGRWRRTIGVGLALTAGVILTAPSMIIGLEMRGSAPNLHTWNWIPQPSLGATFALFNKATGTYAFPLLAILAASGVVRQWSVHREALIFTLLWMFVPPIVLTLVSYVLQPAFVERYLLGSFVPFFILAALGLLALRPAAFRPGALALVVALALAHDATWWRKAHGVGFAEAAAAAVRRLGPTDTIGVAPRYAAGVVNYYLRDVQPPRQVEAADGEPPPTVLIIADAFDPVEGPQLRTRYPRSLASFDGVVVRGH
jgi:mannosyltransferase